MADKESFFYYAGIIFVILAVVMSSLLFGVIAVHEDEKYNQDGDELGYEDFEDHDSIQICCAWGDEIDDGTLTYIIDQGGSQLREAVYKSIEEWDAEIEGLTFKEESNRRNANVKIDFQKNEDMKREKQEIILTDM